MGGRVRAYALKGKKPPSEVYFSLEGMCPHSLTHWIHFEKCANTHLNVKLL